jgi:hypothetical protein
VGPRAGLGEGKKFFPPQNPYFLSSIILFVRLFYDVVSTVGVLQRVTSYDIIIDEKSAGTREEGVCRVLF